MTRSNKISLVILCIFLIVLSVGLYLMGNFIGNYSDIIRENKTAQEYKQSLSRLSDYDYKIYYIGNKSNLSDYGLNLSDRLTFEKYLEFVNPGDVNSDTMPVPWEPVDITRYDGDGNIIEIIKGRVYPQNMFIIVDKSSVLTSDEWEIIRQCTIGNNVPLLIMGPNNISSFKSILLWADAFEYIDSFLFIDAHHYKNNVLSQDNVLVETDNKNIAPRQFVSSIVDIILDVWGPLPSTEESVG